MTRFKALLAVLVSFLIASPAGAATVDFEDFSMSGSGLVPDEYRGLLWNQFNYNSGTYPQATSGQMYAFNRMGQATSIQIMAGSVFTFTGGSLTGYDGLEVWVRGAGPGKTYEPELLTFEASTPIHLSVNWTDISSLTFSPVYTMDNYQIENYFKRTFTMDDLHLSGIRELDQTSNVPLPAALPLFGTGLLALAAKARKRKAN